MTPPLGLLRRLQRLYVGPPVFPGAEPAAPPALLAVAKARGAATVEPPPAEVIVLVVGDAGSGKSCFINSYAQELLLPPPEAHQTGGKAFKPPPLHWVRSSNASSGCPRLLTEMAAQFPDALGANPRSCLCGASGSQRLDAVDLVEVRAEALADAATASAILWLAERAGVVLCLADSQRQPCLSSELLNWLKRVVAVAPQAVQIVLSRVDLVVRSSDRIRLTAKISKQLSDGVGRSFEVLPISGKSKQQVLLEALETAPSEVTVGGKVFKVSDDGDAPAGGDAGGSGEEAGAGSASSHDAGSARALKAAEACAAERLTEGLARLQDDALKVRSAAEARLTELPDPASSEGSANLRPLLLQLSFAVAIAAVLAPMLVEEEWDANAIFWVRSAAGSLVAFMLLVCMLTRSSPASASPAPAGVAGAGKGDLAAPTGREAIEAMSFKLREEVRFCNLVLQQWKVWSGPGA